MGTEQRALSHTCTRTTKKKKEEEWGVGQEEEEDEDSEREIKTLDFKALGISELQKEDCDL